MHRDALSLMIILTLLINLGQPLPPLHDYDTPKNSHTKHRCHSVWGPGLFTPKSLSVLVLPGFSVRPIVDLDEPDIERRERNEH